jgi:hypothetical protein
MIRFFILQTLFRSENRGIYNSAALVSANNELGRSIHKHALESKLLGSIGHAEMEKEIQNTVKQVNIDKIESEKELEEPVELDDMELEIYIEFVVREVKKGVHINRSVVNITV